MTHFVSKDKIIENLRVKRRELEDKLEAIKEVLKLPKCESVDETPDIILGFKEQFYLKKILEGEG